MRTHKTGAHRRSSYLYDVLVMFAWYPAVSSWRDIHWWAMIHLTAVECVLTVLLHDKNSRTTGTPLTYARAKQSHDHIYVYDALLRVLDVEQQCGCVVLLRKNHKHLGTPLTGTHKDVMKAWLRLLDVSTLCFVRDATSNPTV